MGREEEGCTWEPTEPLLAKGVSPGDSIMHQTQRSI